MSNLNSTPRPNFDQQPELRDPDRQGYILESIHLSRKDKLTIASLEQNNASDVYVLNTSSGNSAGVITFQIAGTDGNLVPIEIPYTYVALNLAELVNPRSLLNSESFRRVVAKGLLTIISPDHADRINESREAQIELQNIANGVPVGVADSSNTLSGSNYNKTAPKQQELNEVNGLTFTQSQLVGNLQVDPRIVTIMNNESVTEEERLNLLRNNQNILKLVDAYYIKRAASAEDETSVIKASKKIISHLVTEAREDFKTDEEFEKYNDKCKKAARNALKGNI